MAQLTYNDIADQLRRMDLTKVPTVDFENVRVLLDYTRVTLLQADAEMRERDAALKAREAACAARELAANEAIASAKLVMALKPAETIAPKVKKGFFG